MSFIRSNINEPIFRAEIHLQAPSFSLGASANLSPVNTYGPPKPISVPNPPVGLNTSASVRLGPGPEPSPIGLRTGANASASFSLGAAPLGAPPSLSNYPRAGLGAGVSLSPLGASGGYYNGFNGDSGSFNTGPKPLGMSPSLGSNNPIPTNNSAKRSPWQTSVSDENGTTTKDNRGTVFTPTNQVASDEGSAAGAAAGRAAQATQTTQDAERGRQAGEATRQAQGLEDYPQPKTPQWPSVSEPTDTAVGDWPSPPDAGMDTADNTPGWEGPLDANEIDPVDNTGLYDGIDRSNSAADSLDQIDYNQLNDAGRPRDPENDPISNYRPTKDSLGETSDYQDYFGPKSTEPREGDYQDSDLLINPGKMDKDVLKALAPDEKSNYKARKPADDLTAWAVSSAGFVSPEESPVDYIILGGSQSPGYCEIVDLKVESRLIVNSGVGMVGARIMFAGYEPITFTVRIHLYNTEMYNLYQNSTFKKKLYLKKPHAAVEGTNPWAGESPVYNIIHPFLNDPIYGIADAVIKSIKGPERLGDAGEWIVDIQFVSAKKIRTQLVRDISNGDGTVIDEFTKKRMAQQAREDELNAQAAGIDPKQLPPYSIRP